MVEGQFGKRNGEIERDDDSRIVPCLQLRNILIDIDDSFVMESEKVGPTLVLKPELPPSLVEDFLFDGSLVCGSGVFADAGSVSYSVKFLDSGFRVAQSGVSLRLEQNHLGGPVKDDVIVKDDIRLGLGSGHLSL